MRQFTTQDTRPTFQFSCLSVILCLLISTIVGILTWSLGGENRNLVAVGIAFAVFIGLLLGQCKYISDY